VIPGEASVKVSFRLVGDQDPKKVSAAFEKHVRARIPADCSVEFIRHKASRAIRLPFDMPAEYQFACTAHVSGQMTIVVDEAPTQLLARLRWRASALVHAISRFAQAKER
jgi:acetylornithine deacetylase/succinyl-diaminopimelate desuccinylase-like protein